MTDSKSKRRMLENEAVFRQRNEAVVKDFTELLSMAKDEHQVGQISGLDSPILFFCECADESCNEHLKLRPSVYASIHQKRDHFIILPGHQVPTIEVIVKKEPNYEVVKKYQKPTADVEKLQPTGIKNT